MTSFHTRAAKIFGTGQDGIYWPYDVSGIDRTLRRTNPERFQQQLTELERKRLVIVEWAEQHGLKGSPVKCCPWWLTRKVSRRCEFAKCTRYGSSAQTVDSGWLDHTMCWLKDSRPAVITSAPYNFRQKDRERIDWWLTKDTRLRTAHGAGWYGYGTTQVVLWRADRLEVVEPAAVEVQS